jgi:internalin A
LMAVIRSDFERIHHDIRNLQPQEMVPLPGFPEAVIPYQELLVMEKENEEQSKIHKTNKEFNKVVNNQVVKLDIHVLLNGVDLEHTRRRERAGDRPKRTIELFCSYSHIDESFRNELEIHLKLLQREGRIEAWHDRKVGAGDDWARKISENLERAEIILLLVSANFIASDYCYENEMKRALERHENRSARVIPVILRDVNWGTAPFAKLQALPKNGVPVAKWLDKDSAWRMFLRELRE